ncbi:MAG: glycerophosphodiester phosphodiesterase [Proteobacteria bacterium]|nr:glycerophosphodiester phosphodiesterase [Pseudomonadota bacterium]
MIRRLVLLAIVIVLAAACWAPVFAKVDFRGFDFEAHRGGRDERPENTLAAFRHAIELGVTTLELDVQLTRDLVPVLGHNPRLVYSVTRDPNGRWLTPAHEPVVHNLLLSEVETYDVGGINPADTEYYADHGKTQKVSPHERVPTLDALFDMVEKMGNTRVCFNVETKSYATEPSYGTDPYTFTAIVLEVIKRHHLENRCIIQSFDWRTLIETRRLDKSMTTSALTCEVPEWGEEGWYRHVGEKGCSPWMAGLDIDDYNGDYVKAAHAINADIVSPYLVELTPALVAEAHTFGMKVVPWTVNKREDMERLIGWGVDGLITDRPTLLKQVLDARGITY